MAPWEKVDATYRRACELLGQGPDLHTSLGRAVRQLDELAREDFPTEDLWDAHRRVLEVRHLLDALPYEATRGTAQRIQALQARIGRERASALGRR